MVGSIFASLRRAGATLAVEDGQLHLRGNGAAPPPALAQAVRDNRAALMLALGAPRREVVLSEVRKLRPYLTESLQRLDDEGLLMLVDWHLRVGLERARGRLDS